MKTVAATVRAWAAARAWLIRPGTLDAYIAAIDARRAVRADSDDADPAAPPGPESRLEVIDGVAIVPVVGPLIEGPSACERMMMGLFGGGAYDDIRADLEEARRSHSVRAILLDVDSPGGEVNGVEATAEAVRAAARDKPLVAHVRGSGSSAAYWLASQAPRLTAGSTAHVGSIGVALEWLDDRRALAQAGIDLHEFVSSNAPRKRPDPATEAGRLQILAHLDGIEALFLEAVAAGRGVSVAKVLDDFGRGDTLIAAEALDVGMLDAVESRDVAMKLLQKRITGAGRPKVKVAAASGPKARLAQPRPCRVAR